MEGWIILLGRRDDTRKASRKGCPWSWHSQAWQEGTQNRCAQKAKGQSGEPVAARDSLRSLWSHGCEHKDKHEPAERYGHHRGKRVVPGPWMKRQELAQHPRRASFPRTAELSSAGLCCKKDSRQCGEGVRKPTGAKKEAALLKRGEEREALARSLPQAH